MVDHGRSDRSEHDNHLVDDKSQGKVKGKKRWSIWKLHSACAWASSWLPWCIIYTKEQGNRDLAVQTIQKQEECPCMATDRNSAAATRSHAVFAKPL
jgi:hypothetical protein